MVNVSEAYNSGFDDWLLLYNCIVSLECIKLLPMLDESSREGCSELEFISFPGVVAGKASLLCGDNFEISSNATFAKLSRVVVVLLKFVLLIVECLKISFTVTESISLSDIIKLDELAPDSPIVLGLELIREVGKVSIEIWEELGSISPYTS